MAYKIFIFVICIGMVWAQSEPSISDAISNLPPQLQGTVDEKQVTEIKNKSIEVFKKKCEENSGPHTYQKVEKAFGQFNDCLRSLVNTQTLQQEIENAKPNGQVDEVFKKYCQKTPQFKGCFKTMTETVKPCFSTNERKNLKTVYNITEQLVDFVCYKEGDRIALFIAEEGPECIQEKQPQIETCFNNTFGSELQFNKDNLALDNIPTIDFGVKECNQLTSLQQCVVSVLETCSASTSANILEALFKFVRKATPCKDITPDAVEKKSGNTGNRLAINSMAFGAIIFALL